jgi:hypothetical protein
MDKLPTYDIPIYEKEGIQHVYSYQCSICEQKITLNYIPSPSQIPTVCRACFHDSTRRVERPSKQQLYEDLLQNSFVKVAERYGVSDNAVRKWCKYYDIPFKSSDYRKLQK